VLAAAAAAAAAAAMEDAGSRFGRRKGGGLVVQKGSDSLGLNASTEPDFQWVSEHGMLASNAQPILNSQCLSLHTHIASNHRSVFAFPSSFFNLPIYNTQKGCLYRPWRRTLAVVNPSRLPTALAPCF
jgi:hypothetical protein